MASDAEILKVAKQRFKFANDAKKNQRDREREDLGFYEGDTQWPSDIKSLRAGRGATSGLPAVPARPCLTINKIRDPIRRIQNDELQADLGMSVIPADDFGGDIDENEIELREGLARRIQRQSNAKDARMWAANRAAICGTGWYQIVAKWIETSDSFDQEIEYLRVYDQFGVLEDPAHEQPDGSDIEFIFKGREIPWKLYQELYPKLANEQDNPLANGAMSDSEFASFEVTEPDWVHQDGENRFVRVTEYWYYDRERYEIVALDDGAGGVRVVRASTIDPAVLKTFPKYARRERIVKKVTRCVIDGVHVLEQEDWPGKFIPFVKVVGEEVHVFDKERRYEGLVRPSRDAQKAFNAMISSAVETIALAPKSPWLAPSRAVENFESLWDQQAVRNWPVLFYNDMDPNTGQPITPPQRQIAEPPIQAMAAMLSAFDQAIMQTIGQANLADTHPDVRSGEMASRLIDEAARGTSNYLSNLIRSVHYEGTIVNDLLYPIYGKRKGRILSMMNGSQKTERVMMATPFVIAENGMPQRHDPMMNPQHAEMEPKTYTLTEDGSFNVAIEATKFYETKQAERLSLMAGLIEKSPEQLAIIGDRFFELAGDEDMAKRYRAVLHPAVVEMLQQGQPVDPRLREAMQHGQMLAQEMVQLKADKHARIEQAQIKALADAATTDQDNKTKLQIAQGDNATAILIAELKNQIAEQGQQVQMLMEAEKARQEEMRTLEKFSEERRLMQEHAHDVGMANVEHAHAKDLLSHEAAVMPAPSTNGSGE